MFQEATEIAGGFTYPVIISVMRKSGKVTAQIGAFVMLNSDGWAITAGHIFNRHREAERDQKASIEWQAEFDAINTDTSVTSARKQTLLKRLRRPDPEWITRYSYSWGFTPATMREIHVDPLADLALVGLDGFPVDQVRNFPTFGNPARHVKPGASLCRLGYPFNVLGSSWDAPTGAFALSQDNLPLALFPLEGMHTRTAVYVESTAGGRTARFLETSTPGLLGQSGGPIYGVDGTVWAIQSQTRHVELGFSPTVKVDGRNTVEHQILNLGLGADVTEVIRFANEQGVAINVQP